MTKIVIPVFMGGAVGAILREFFMLVTPKLADDFPLDILVANLVASLLLGYVTALHRRKAASDGVNLLLGTGLAGGLSTFSSFAFGIAVLTTTSSSSTVVAAAYAVISLVAGYVAVIVGLKLGGRGRPTT
jgi:CrcB protein